METKLFKSNRSQAVRLPKAVAFPEGIIQVKIITIGKSRLITPQDAVWDDFFDDPENAVSDDFMAAREQPEPQRRDSF